MSSPVRVFAPASVSNVGCGFDILGFALEAPGDVVVAEPSRGPQADLVAVEGDGGALPREAARNAAAVAAQSLLDATGARRGVRLRLIKGMAIGTGLGSSAASAVAAVVATDRALGLGADRPTLLTAALAGEAAACGTAHADNAAPALYGGFVLVRAGGPGGHRVTTLAQASRLFCAVVRPHVVVETRAARALLPLEVPLADAVAQAADLGAFVAALARGDIGELASCVSDRFAEPHRAALVPGFAAAVAAARRAGAVGAGLSGSGPSLFALVAGGRDDAQRVALSMAAALAELDVACDQLTSPVGAPGARVLGPDEPEPWLEKTGLLEI